MLKVPRRNTPDLQDILVTAVAWNRHRNDLRALGSQPVHQAAHRLHGRRVVGIVQNHPERMLIVNVQAAGGPEEGVVKGA
jgi:hypothetical protein